MLPGFLSAQQAVPQAAKSPAVASRPAPRTADGKPDLNGVYQGGSNRVGTWEEANQGVGVRGAGDRSPATAVPRPPSERPAYQPWAAKLVLDDYNLRNINSETARCIPNIAMITTGLFPVQIFQNSQNVVIIQEYMSVHRIIPLNAKHPDDIEPTYMGDSVGHWEGDSLVVDTIDFKEGLHSGGGGGRMHSDALHLTERFTRVNFDQINYDVVWDDPKVLTKPTNYYSTLMLRPGTRVQEFRCEENNLEPARYEELKKDESLFKRK